MLLLSLFPLSLQTNYVPVVFIYGMGGDPSEFKNMRKTVEALYPGIYTTSKRIGHGAVSSIDMAMQEQIDEFAALVRGDPVLSNGFNILTHSQGGIIGRGYVEQHNDPPVRRLVTLAAPHGGFFCDRVRTCPEPIGFFTGFIEKHVYSDFVQEHVAPASYWRSPLQRQAYLNSNAVLPVIDNEKQINQTYRDHIQGLDYFVMVGNDKDGMITPWQSMFFGFHPDGDDSTVVDMEERDIYKKDLIGLKTLDQAKKLIKITSPGIKHNDYGDDKYSEWMKDNVWVWFNDRF